MAKFKIRTKQYCGLAQEQNWQSWLQSVCQELHDDLIDHLSRSRSCRSNHIKMTDIQKGLEKRGLMRQMVMFLQKEYPYAIEEIRTKTPVKTKPCPTRVVGRGQNSDVFEYYNPNLLTFPQKIVLENEDQALLLKEIKDFCQGKISVDYIVIGNKAYIEYFKLKYAKEADKVLPYRREIYKYRLKYGISQNERVAKIE